MVIIGFFERVGKLENHRREIENFFTFDIC